MLNILVAILKAYDVKKSLIRATDGSKENRKYEANRKLRFQPRRGL